MTDIAVAESPDQACVTALAGRFSPTNGTFALQFPTSANQQTIRRKSMSICLFQALGKKFGMLGAYTVTTTDFRANIPHWFAAYPNAHLVVFDGHLLPPSGIRELADATKDAADRVTFVADPGFLQVTVRAVRASGAWDTAPTIKWEALVDSLPVQDGTPPEPDDGYTVDHLPVTDFLLFRYEARTLNTADRFTVIDTDYHRAYAAAQDLDADIPAVVRHLTDQTRDATTTAPLMVALRATQAAFFARGWLLRADEHRALGAMCVLRSPRPTHQNWVALHGHIRTERVAGVALFLLNTPLADLNTVTVGDITQALADGQINGQPIPEIARPLLLAHHRKRLTEDATPDAPFLNQRGDRRHLEDLIDARRDLNLPIDPRSLHHPDVPHNQRPLIRYGLHLQELT